jgi:minor extracellular serine protease Vpr
MKNKRFLLLVIFLLSGLWIMAQVRVNVEELRETKRNGKAAKPTISLNAPITSASTGKFLLDLFQNELNGQEMDSSLIDRYALIEKNGEYYVNAFLLLSENANLNELESLRLQFQGNTTGKVLSALIPLGKIKQVINHPDIKHIGVSEKARPTMDNARTATWVHWVHQGQQLNRPYYGDGVIIGIIDKGFDYTHPNFYDGSGTNNYRILRVWEQNVTSGTPPSGYNYGRELVGQTAILNAQRDENNESHGTHVAGIAAGAGGGVNTDYIGVAPKANLVLVSTNFSDAGIGHGVEYILNYAASVGKPCVINMSINGLYGPHDGTSLFDQFCNTAVGPGKILVSSAGNCGGERRYVGKSFTNTDTIFYTFLKNDNTSQQTDAIGDINIWGNANTNYWVAVNIWNSNTNSFEDWTPYLPANTTSTNSYTLFDNDPVFPDECLVSISTTISSLNNKPEVYISIDNSDQDDSYRWAMIEVIAYNTQTKMWSVSLNQKSSFTNGGYGAPFLNGSTSSTVGEIGGTGPSMISVGAYTSKNNWTAFNGSNQNAPFFAAIGAVAPFSSKGPTADGRTKPDISAPGNVIISSTSRFDQAYQSNSNDVVTGITNGSSNWWFSSMQGTSMSAPMVTGILALWLEVNPNLTPQTAKNYMKNTAIKDSHTGNIGSNGSNTWGWGKIDAHDGLLDVIQSVIGIIEIDSTKVAIYPNPASDFIRFSFTSPQFVHSVEIFDLTGRLVISKSIQEELSGVFELSIQHVSEGIYLVKVQTLSGFGVQKLTVH